MLRFERKSRNRDVSISLRSQEKVLNSLSLTAFGLALGIHLMGFIAFQVSPFKIIDATTVIPPVIVRTDINQLPDSTVYVVMEATNEIMPKISHPPYSNPELPRFPKSQNLSFDPGEI